MVRRIDEGLRRLFAAAGDLALAALLLRAAQQLSAGASTDLYPQLLVIVELAASPGCACCICGAKPVTPRYRSGSAG